MELAANSCPRGGVNCPNTTSAVADKSSMRPARLRQLLATMQALADQLAPIGEAASAEHQALRDADAAMHARIVALEAQSAKRPVVRLASLTLASLGTNPIDVAITWHSPMPSVAYDVTISDSRIALVGVKNQSIGGVTVTLRASALITAVNIIAAASGLS